MNDISKIYNPQAIEFATVAKEYLAFLESAKNMSSEEFLDTSLRILPLLYLKGLNLPQVEDYDEEYAEKFVDEPTWSYIQQTSAAKLGEDDNYVQIQDVSVVNSMDYLNVGLSELFADLYQEMGDFIGAYRLAQEETMQAALYISTQNFSSYWGIRLLVLLENLHKVKFHKSDID
ncbi:MAG: DUF5063 domain-containing protein [Bacteroidales bacterium]|nr:DUF5063 domain-containing protein [Bacteroidales bacterium]